MPSLLARIRKMTAKLRPRKKTAEVRVASVARCPGKSRFEQERRKAFADDLLQQAPIVSMQEAWFDEAPAVSRDAQTVSQRDSDSDDKRSSSDYSSIHSSIHSSSESRYSSSDYSSSSSDYSSSDSGGSSSSSCD